MHVPPTVASFESNGVRLPDLNEQEQANIVLAAIYHTHPSIHPCAIPRQTSTGIYLGSRQARPESIKDLLYHLVQIKIIKLKV